MTRRGEALERLMEMSLRERVVWAIGEFADGNQTAFAKLLGAQREQVSRWAGGRQGIDQSNAAKFERLTDTPQALWTEPQEEWIEQRIRRIEADVQTTRLLLESREANFATAADVEQGIASLREAIALLARSRTDEGGQTDSAVKDSP